MQYVVSNGDSLTAVIPTAELTFVFKPSITQVTPLEAEAVEEKEKALNIKNKFLSVIDDIINSV